MKIKLPNDIKIYIACGKTDMRKSIDRLSAIVTQNFNLNPFENALFLFCDRRKDRMKALYWEGDGFLLLYKRLENGVFQWAKTSEEVREITHQQYRWLIKGLSIDQKKVIKKVSSEATLPKEGIAYCNKLFEIEKKLKDLYQRNVKKSASNWRNQY